jgi:hypothetical protein
VTIEDDGRIRTQLAALASALDRLIEQKIETYKGVRPARGLMVWLKEVQPHYNTLRTCLAELRSSAPSVFGAVPDRLPESIDTADQKGQRVVLTEVMDLLRDVRYCLDLLPAPAVQVSLAVTREGVFFAGQRTDAMKLVLDIVATAKTKLEVIDGYLDLGTLSLLTKEPKVRVEILTKPLDSSTTTALVTLSKGKQLQVRTSAVFHDRFLCVDDRDVYHFGASIKDAGGRGFMFSRVEEPTVVKALRDEWARAWTAATVVV